MARWRLICSQVQQKNSSLSQLYLVVRQVYLLNKGAVVNSDNSEWQWTMPW